MCTAEQSTWLIARAIYVRISILSSAPGIHSHLSAILIFIYSSVLALK